jgi:hypothetical protein
VTFTAIILCIASQRVFVVVVVVVVVVVAAAAAAAAFVYFVIDSVRQLLDTPAYKTVASLFVYSILRWIRPVRHVYGQPCCLHSDGPLGSIKQRIC